MGGLCRAVPLLPHPQMHPARIPISRREGPWRRGRHRGPPAWFPSRWSPRPYRQSLPPRLRKEPRSLARAVPFCPDKTPGDRISRGGLLRFVARIFPPGGAGHFPRLECPSPLPGPQASLPRLWRAPYPPALPLADPPTSTAWDAKVKADFASMWNGGVETIHSKALSTDSQVKAAMPFHFSDVKSALNDNMRLVGSLADSSTSRVQETTDKITETFEDAVGSGMSMLTGKKK